MANENCNCYKIEEIQEMKTVLNSHEERIREIESDRKLQEFQYTQIMDKLGQLDKKIEGILDRPSQYIYVILSALITAIIAGLIAYFLR